MIAMGCAICQEQKYIAHKGQQPLPRCERHPDRCMIDWSYIKRYSEDKLLGEIVSDQYVLIRPLGKGGFGSVYFAIQKQDNQSINYNAVLSLLLYHLQSYKSKSKLTLAKMYIDARAHKCLWHRHT